MVDGHDHDHDVFGYVTAALATYFIGRDADSDEGEVAGAKAIARLQAEIAGLRADLALRTRDGRDRPNDGR